MKSLIEKVLRKKSCWTKIRQANNDLILVIVSQDSEIETVQVFQVEKRTDKIMPTGYKTYGFLMISDGIEINLLKFT